MKANKIVKSNTVLNSMNRLEKMLREQGIKRGTLIDAIKFIRNMAREGRLSDSGMCIKLQERYLKKDWFTGVRRMTTYRNVLIYLTDNQASAINKRKEDSMEVELDAIQINSPDGELIDIPVRKYGKEDE